MQSYKSKTVNAKSLSIVLILIVLLYILYSALRSSLFFQKQDRVNIVFYGEYPHFYSLGLSDNTNFVIKYFPDLMVSIPGGYGSFRLGALNKFVDLEKKPDLILKTFSINAFSFVDYYFYPNDGKIYFGGPKKDHTDLTIGKEIFALETNANIFDKLYLYLYFLGKKTDDFKVLNQDGFFETYQGYFYKEVYRNERKSIQIKYNKSYKTAVILSQMIEGEGIRVVDVSEDDKPVSTCKVIEDSNKSSVTAKILTAFFRCQPIVGSTQKFDIILELGHREKEWEIY